MPQEQSSESIGGSGLKRNWPKLALIALGLLFAGRAVHTYGIFSAAFDEGYHLAAAIDHYQYGEFGIYYWNTPLARYCNGLLPYWNGVRLPGGAAKVELGLDQPAISAYVLGEGENYWTTLSLARLGTLFFLPLLIFGVYRWGAELYGRRAGVAAAALLTLSPTVIAHGSLVTADFGAAATIVTAAYLFWKWLRDESRTTLALTALACGAAVATKYTALVFLPPVFLAIWIARLFAPGASAVAAYTHLLKKLLFAGAWCALATWAFLWCVYQFHTRPINPDSARLHRLIDTIAEPGGSVNETLFAAGTTILPWIMPPIDFLKGLESLTTISRQGHPAYLLGETSRTGWWYYFPVAIALKTTLPLLLLIAIALAGMFAGTGKRERLIRSLPLIGSISAILVPAAFATADIGVRYLLPIYPFMALLASSVFDEQSAPRWRRWHLTGMALLTWHGVESAAAQPDYLAYFNEIGRGREDRLLGDSNLDWGQDLGRLSRYASENSIQPLHLAYFGTTRPEAVGLEGTQYLKPGDRPSGWLAVSVTKLQGIYPGDEGYGWLRDYEPTVRIGKSIYLYDFTGGL